MNDKDKMIEEMAKVIGNTWLVDLDGDTKDVREVLDRADIESIAREFYNAGYRKIDKDSVVLTRGEYDCLIEMPCVREISSPLGKYEAVYINERDLTQQCLVSSKNEGWLIIEKYGCDKHSTIAKERLKEKRQ
jgi:hypothetical protein